MDMDKLDKQGREILEHASSIGCFTWEDLGKSLPAIKAYCHSIGICVSAYVGVLTGLSIRKL